MLLKDLDAVVLERDVPAHGLCRGDIGTVVHVNSAESVEVEFVRASGRTQALLTLSANDVRRAGDQDVIATRSAGSH